MASFEPWKNNLILFEGIDQMGDGSNGGGGHQRGKTGCLTGQPNNNGRAAGISVDQLIANEIGKGTRFKSLQSSVFVKGTLWRGRSIDGPIAPGTRVRVRGVDGLILRVEPEADPGDAGD